MRWIVFAMAVVGVLLCAPVANAYEMDFTFSNSSGTIVLVDTFNKVGKSDVNITAVKELMRENKQLQQNVRTLQSQLERLEKRVKELERKK